MAVRKCAGRRLLAFRQRAEGVKRYEVETGQLVKKKADLDKWSARLKTEKQKLVVNKPAAKAGKKGAVDKKQQFTLKSVLPLNLEQERDQLLASFVQPVQEAADKGAAAGK